MIDEEQQILLLDPEAYKIIREMLLLNYSSTLFVFPGVTVHPEEYHLATLVIALIDSDHAKTLTAEKELPKNTPILFLGTEERLPSVCADNATSRLVDYLRVPVSKEIFLHRVSLLTQMQRITTTFSQQLNRLNNRDSLTGFYNRYNLTSQLSEIFCSTQESEKELSVLIINVDHFGNVDSLLGLDFGDYIVNQILARLTRTLRDIDMCYRFSEGEFIIILPEANLQFAMAMAQKINETCSGSPFNDGSHTASIAVSIGIASLQAHQPDNPNKLIFMAEKALFEAKVGGRHRICIYTNKGIENNLPQLNPLAFLQDKLGRIFKKARSSALSSLEHLAENVAGPEHKEQIASVSHYISLLCSYIGIPTKHIQTCKNSITLYNCFRALLHNDLLMKPDKLTGDERKIIEDLPYKLTDLADMLDYFADERSLLLSFNERYDGTGYPDGLKGDEIPLGARLFHIADAMAAMNADRPFRKKLLPKEIIKELKQGAGRQFDPFLVFQLLTVIEQNVLIDIAPEFLLQTRQDIMNSFTQHRP